MQRAGEEECRERMSRGRKEFEVTHDNKEVRTSEWKEEVVTRRKERMDGDEGGGGKNKRRRSGKEAWSGVGTSLDQGESWFVVSLRIRQTVFTSEKWERESTTGSTGERPVKYTNYKGHTNTIPHPVNFQFAVFIQKIPKLPIPVNCKHS